MITLIQRPMTTDKEFALLEKLLTLNKDTKLVWLSRNKTTFSFDSNVYFRSGL